MPTPRRHGAKGGAGQIRRPGATGRVDKSPKLNRTPSKTAKDREAEMYAELKAAEAAKKSERLEMTLHRGEFERRTSGATSADAAAVSAEEEDEDEVQESAALRFGLAAAQIDLKSDAGNGSQPGPRVVASASPEVDEEADLDPDVSDEFVVGESAGAGEADDDDDYPEDFSDDFEDESDGDGGDDVLAPHRGPQRQTPPQGANNVSFKDEDAEMDDVLRAMQSENDKLSAGTSDGTSAPASGQHQQPSSANGVDAGPEFASRMNFRKAKATARNRSTSKSQRRWSDLAKLVELHSVPFTLFEQPPTSEYELYIRNYGDSGRVQCGVQCGVEVRDATEQTVKIKSKTRWSQHPPTELKAVGNGDGTYDDEEADTASSERTTSQHLGKFLNDAAAVCLTLLEESSGLLGSAATKPAAAQLAFADRVTQLAAGLPVFSGRQVVSAEFLTVRPHLLLIAYGAPLGGSADHPSTSTRPPGCLCLWNTREPSSPMHVFVSESTPQCCCFDPRKACLAFAATEEGSIVVWDMREAPSLHLEQTVAGSTYRLRRPTYSTDGIPSTKNHQAQVVAMCSVAAVIDGEGSAMSESPSASFQLATLDADGVFKTWTVVEESEADPAGSLNELGLMPGGRTKILPGATVTLSTSRCTADADFLQSTCFQLFPDRPNQFIAGTSQAGVLRGVRFGERHSPRQYIRGNASSAQVCSVHFHPVARYHFLVGYSNGDVCLYHVDFAAPVEVWLEACDSAVQWVQWSALRPAVFFALSARGTLAIWDILESSTAPVERINTLSGRDGGEVVAVALSVDPESSELALAYRGGSIECYRLKERFSAAVPNEIHTLQQFLQSAY